MNQETLLEMAPPGLAVTILTILGPDVPAPSCLNRGPRHRGTEKSHTPPPSHPYALSEFQRICEHNKMSDILCC